MRKVVSLACLAILATVALSPGAGARAAKPVKTSLYLHGYTPFGELDGADWFANGTPPMQMDKKKPTESAPKSMRLGTPGLNTSCTGLPLGFPTWVGNLSGTIVGDAKLTLHTASTPSNVTARIWVDTPVFSCNEAYIEPAAEVIAEVPAGHGHFHVVFKDLKLEAGSTVMIELIGTGVHSNGRVLYDTPDLASVLQFKCIPARGKSCA
jgi:hypothetical protein